MRRPRTPRTLLHNLPPATWRKSAKLRYLLLACSARVDMLASTEFPRITGWSPRCRGFASLLHRKLGM